MAEGQKLKDRGLELVEMNNSKFVSAMRSQAAAICKREHCVTSDDLREYALMVGVKPEHPNAWGAIFSGKKWECIGRIKSTLSSNHAREIRVWALAE